MTKPNALPGRSSPAPDDLAAAPPKSTPTLSGPVASPGEPEPEPAAESEPEPTPRDRYPHLVLQVSTPFVPLRA